MAAVEPAVGSGQSSVKCVRCRTAPAELTLPQTGAYCTPCATSIFHIKAKSGLDRARGACLAHAQRVQTWKGKAKAADDGAGPDEKGIAIAFSGGAASVMLLEAVAQYFLPDGLAIPDEDAGADAAQDVSAAAAPKSKLKKKDTRRMDAVAFLSVLYVDDAAMSGSLSMNGHGAEEEEARTARIERLRRTVHSISPSSKFVPLKLEDVFKPSSLQEEEEADYVFCTSAPSSSRFLLPDKNSAEHFTPRQALQQLHNAINPPPSEMPRLAQPAAQTRSEDLRRILTHRLLRRTAREQGACVLLLGDTMSGAAVRFIEAITKGEGGKAALEGAPAAWMSDLLVCRPLREILAQEVHFQVQALGRQSETSSQDDYLSARASGTERSSIGRLTNGFIANLESNVASTVSTVTRTASKIVLDLPTVFSSGVERPAPVSTLQKDRQVQAVKEDSVTADSSNSESQQKGSRSQPTFGSAAQRLIRIARELPSWDELMNNDAVASDEEATSRACPLCGMPAHTDKARGWKESISIMAAASPPTNGDDTVGQGSTIDLSALLCYGCALVLDTPPSTAKATAPSSRPPMPLPGFVLEAARRLLFSRPIDS